MNCGNIKEGNDISTECEFTEIKVTKDDILNCSYSHWSSKYRKHLLSEFKIFKPLPKEFIEYLDMDGIALPKTCKSDSVLFQDVEPNSDNDYSDWEDDEIPTKSDSNTDPTVPFKEFHDELVDTIVKFGSVAPKYNWSSPQDAVWMLTSRNMRCYSTSDLFLLLKSSDYLNHDRFHAFDEVNTNPKPDNTEFELEVVLRKWVDVNPSMEFRCFVRDRQLISISQRDLNYYSFLDELKDDFMEKIGLFFDDVLMSTFDSNSFVFDVYIPKPFNRVYLIDINPFQRSTDSLLFSWNELATMEVDEDDVVFRLVTEHNSGRFVTKAHSENHVPRDFLDASVDTQSMVDFLKKCNDMQLEDDSNSDQSETENIPK